MTSDVDWLMSKFGTNFARNLKFHIRMTILFQLRDSVTPVLHTAQLSLNIMDNIFYDDCFRFCYNYNFKYYWGMFEIPDIFGGNLSGKVFLGYRADAGVQPM